MAAPGSPDTLTWCAECGTPLPSGTECRSLFEAMLALEWTVPGGSGDSAHFFAVTSYVLQHPAGMAYRADALARMRALLADVVRSDRFLADVRRQMREEFDGGAKVRRRPSDTIPTWLGVRWTMTVHDVLRGGAGAYRDTVEAWARSVVSSLDAMRA